MEENNNGKKINQRTLVLIIIASIASVAGFGAGIWALVKYNSPSKDEETQRNQKIALHLKNATDQLLKDKVTFKVQEFKTINYQINSDQNVTLAYCFLDNQNHYVNLKASLNVSSFSLDTLFKELAEDKTSSLSSLSLISYHQLLGNKITGMIKGTIGDYVVSKSSTYHEKADDSGEVYSSGIMTHSKDSNFIIYTDGLLNPNDLTVDYSNAIKNEINILDNPYYYSFSYFLSKTM